jgi:putative peptidoglycan lipid II flippase
VLVSTQLLNIGLVPVLQHAGLALSIGLGATLNAALLLVGLLRRGSYQPSEGWGRFVLQVVAASAVLAIFLIWASRAYDWTAAGHGWQRMGTMALALAASAVVYFGACWAAGIQLRRLLRHG